MHSHRVTRTSLTVRRAKMWIRLALMFLIAMHVTLAVVTAKRTSVTIDEAGHLASGITHHQQGSFASYRVNPPGARWLATLPVVLFMSPPRLVPIADVPGRRPEGTYGAELATALGSRYSDVVFVARLPNIFYSAIGLCLVFLLGRKLFGIRGGLLAATVYAFDPNLLTHAAVLTSDVPATVGFLGATLALLRYLRKPGLVGAAVCGAFLGLAQLTKTSALILYPVFVVVILLRARHVRGGLAVVVLTSLVVLNAGYGFHGTGQRLDQYEFVSKTFRGDGHMTSTGLVGNRFEKSPLRALPVPLPRDYVLGIDLQRRDFEAGALRSYLNGEWHDHGFWFYYVYAIGLKTPLGVLALAVWSLSRGAREAFRRWRERRWSWTARDRSLAVVFAVPAAFFLFISSQTGFSAHLRYVLPALPFVALGVGALGRTLRRAVPSVIVMACVVTSAGSVVSLVPHELSFFNSLAGGWRGGDEHLVDSNIDWGQDLDRLAAWNRDAHAKDKAAAPPLHVAYFGGVDPHIVGLEYTLPPAEPTAGRFAISTNFIRGMQFPAVDGAGHHVVIPEGRYTYFQRWEPTERIGTSIRIYEITEAQAAEAQAASRRASR